MPSRSLIMKKMNMFIIRIELVPQLADILDSINDFIEIFKKETKAELRIIFWYNKSRVLKPIEDKFLESINNKMKQYSLNIYDHCVFKKGIFCDLYLSISEDARSGKDDNCKFYLTYYDPNSFIISLFELFSFIKAKLNYESQQAIDRNVRKVIFSNKVKNN